MINNQTRQSIKDDRQRGGNNQGGYNDKNNNNNRRQKQQDSDGWSVQQNKSRAQPLPFKQFALLSVNTWPTLGKPTNYQNFMVPNTNKFAALPVDTEMDGPTRFVGGGSKNSSMERGGKRASRYYENGGNSQADGR